MWSKKRVDFLLKQIECEGNLQKKVSTISLAFDTDMPRSFVEHADTEHKNCRTKFQTEVYFWVEKWISEVWYQSNAFWKWNIPIFTIPSDTLLYSIHAKDQESQGQKEGYFWSH